MTIEEKQLLLIDLCSRLLYGVVIHTDWKNVKLDRDHCGIGVLYYEHYSEEAKKECGYNVNDFSIIISGCYYGENIKPYLRPMSSMTEEEKNEYYALEELSRKKSNHGIDILDWLNRHHFDYRGLIENGLAIEVNENNNPYID